ncbi:MAG TPA: hypothetical protein VNN20_10395 [Thermodesulfobacteriota bacterium]|nr:hypothetical protein [Thermodesulfobacteriota bacterium]
MRYLLRKAGLGNVPEIEISEFEYLEYKKAQNILSNALAIEEKYEIVIANYIDFEQEILEITTNHMVREHLDYSDFFKVRLGLNIRLVNLLTAVRLYIDQSNQNVTECLPNDSNAKGNVKKLFSKEYDENRDYRFMEALRNYVQHRGIPVHWTQLGGRWISLDDDRLLEYSMELASQRSYLEEDEKMKNSVLDEMDDKVDLKAATRSYIESISKVHDSARSMIAESTAYSRRLIEDAHRRYSEVYSGSLLGLRACIWDEHKQIASVPILLDWDDIRVDLQKRNRKLVNLSKRYVTGAIKTHNKKKQPTAKSSG